jgi:hypothetical protein
MMKKLVVITAAFVLVALVPATALAKGNGVLAAPQLVASGPGCDGANLTFYCLDYTCVTGAMNYAIEAAAVYCGTANGNIIVNFEFNSTSCDSGTFPSGTVDEVDGATFDICDPAITTGCTPITPTAVEFHVKGLGVPKGPKGRQNNPFSNWSPDTTGPSTSVCP